MRLWSLCVLALVLALPVRAAEPESLTKHQKIDRILDMLQTEPALVNSAYQSALATINVIKMKNPGLTPAQEEALGKIVRENTSAIIPEFVNSVKSNWGNAFSEEEIDALYGFYTSEVGRKIVPRMILLQQRTAAEARLIGASMLAPRINAALRANPDTKTLNLN